jgi:hypothetical protein
MMMMMMVMVMVMVMMVTMTTTTMTTTTDDIIRRMLTTSCNSIHLTPLIIFLCFFFFSQNNDRYILTIGTESKSWWLEHGIGCIITNSTWRLTLQESFETSRPIPPEEFVQGCILQYYYVEVIHAAVQVLLSVSEHLNSSCFI